MALLLQPSRKGVLYPLGLMPRKVPLRISLSYSSGDVCFSDPLCALRAHLALQPPACFFALQNVACQTFLPIVSTSASLLYARGL